MPGLDDDLLVIRQQSWSSGLVDRDHPSVIPEDAFSSGQNVDSDELGRIISGPGYTAIASAEAEIASATVAALLGYYNSSGVGYLVGAASNTIKYVQADGDAWTEIVTATSSANEFAFGLGNDLVLISNGTDPVILWDTVSATVTTAGTGDPPAALDYVYADNIMFAARQPAAPDRIDWSAVGDPRTWSQGVSAQNVNTGDGTVITKIVPYSGGLLVSKGDTTGNTEAGSLWFLDLTFSPPFPLRQIDSDFGFMAPRSVLIAGNDILGLSRDGVRSVKRTEFDKFRAGLLSSPIQTLIDTINWGSASKSIAWVHDSIYYLAVPTAAKTTNDLILRYDLRRQHWMTPLPWTANAFATYNDTMYFGEAQASGLVYAALNAQTQHGTAVDWRVVTREWDWGRIDTDKRWRYLRVRAKTSQQTVMAVGASVDEGSFVKIGDIELGETGPKLPVALPFSLGTETITEKIFNITNLAHGRRQRFEFYGSSTGEPVEIVEYEAAGYPKQPRLES